MTLAKQIAALIDLSTLDEGIGSYVEKAAKAYESSADELWIRYEPLSRNRTLLRDFFNTLQKRVFIPVVAYPKTSSGNAEYSWFPRADRFVFELKSGPNQTWKHPPTGIPRGALVGELALKAKTPIQKVDIPEEKIGQLLILEERENKGKVLERMASVGALYRLSGRVPYSMATLAKKPSEETILQVFQSGIDCVILEHFTQIDLLKRRLIKKGFSFRLTQ